MVVSDFVEREARKLCLKHGGWAPDTMVASNALPVGPFGKLVLDFAQQMPAWHLYVPLVRSVLEGVKEPTADMVSAAFCPYGTAIMSSGVETLRAVVDAALNAPQEPSLPNPGGIIPYTVERGESVGEAANRALKAAMEAKS